MSAPMDKTSLRKSARARRKEAFEQNPPDAARYLAGHVLAELQDRPPSTIAAYWAVGSEIAVNPLMIQLVENGWQVALPVVVANAAPLIFRTWSVGDTLSEGPLNTMQPQSGRSEVIPEIVITPLLAFDDQGYRLGQGGGFYDRTLAKLNKGAGRVVSIGVAYAAQRVDVIPRDQFDQRLDYIFTEQGRV